MAYPTIIDTQYVLTNTTYMDDPGYEGDLVINAISSEIVALQTKVGVNSSAVVSTFDYKLSEVLTSGSDKAVGKTATQTLTNKTLTSPIINTPTLTVNDTGLTVQDNSDITKKMQFELSGLTTATTRTITVPDATTTMVGTDATQTLTNKTISTTNLISFFSPQGFLINGRISPTVSSNNLTLAIKGINGSDPSATNPVYVRINNTIRSITAALSVTKNAATNWFNSGSSELATKEIDYFVYLAWDSSNSIVRIGFARIPTARLYSDFSGTTTNEKYAAFNTNPGATDDVEPIGRFAATLSATALFTWSVPTYTTLNLIQRPIFETRVLTYTPAWTGAGSLTYATVTVATSQYLIRGNRIFLDVETTAGTTGGVTNTEIRATAPFTPAVKSAGLNEAGDGATFNLALCEASVSLNVIRFFRDSTFGNWGLGTGRAVIGTVNYQI